MKILIYGAGAIGSYLGAILTLSGEDVTLLARGSQLEAIQSNGVLINRLEQKDQAVTVKAVDVLNAASNYDLIVVTLKAMQLAPAAADLMYRLSSTGSLLMLQNGLPWWYFYSDNSALSGTSIHCLDPERILQKTIDIQRVVGAVIYKPVTQLEPGKIFIPEVMASKLVIGEVNNSSSLRLKTIQALFEKAGFETQITQDIRLAKWQKLMMNLIWNPLCAITQSAPGHIVESPLGENLARNLIAEGLAVANALGMPVDIDENKEIVRISKNFTQQPSMIQDVRAGRSLEIDAILNSVIELATLSKVPVPNLVNLVSLLDVVNRNIERRKKGIDFKI